MADARPRGGRIGLNLAEGNIFSTLLKFSVPILFANLIQQLYNTVDLIIIGKFVGNIGTVGVSTGGDFVNMLTMFAVGFSAAGQVYISQLVGAGEHERAQQTIGTLLTLLVGGSIIIGLVGIILAEPFLRVMNCPEEALSQAKDYMIITCGGAPFVFGYTVVCAILRGMGESKRPLLFVTIAAISNIFMDILFVVVLKMEAAGTAWATIIAQFASFAAAFIFMYRNRDRFNFDFKLKSFAIRKEPLKVILKLGIPRSIQSALINVTLLYCSSNINSYGMIASATNSVGNKITRFSNIITQSIDTGASAMIGQSLGAGKKDRAGRVVHVALAIAMIVCAVNCAAALIIPKQIFGIFTNEQEVIDFGVTFMKISCITFITASLMGPYQAMITGIGNASLGFIVGMLDGVVLRLGISLLLTRVFDMGVLGFFYGNALARLGPVIIGMIYFYSGAWKRRKLLI